MNNFKNSALRAKINFAFVIIILAFGAFTAVAILVPNIIIVLGAAVLVLILIFVMLFILLRTGKKEVDRLSDDLEHLHKSITDLRTESQKVAGKIKKREFGNQIQSDVFLDDFLSVVSSTNSIISAYETELENMTAYMEKFAAGELSASTGYGQKSRHISAASALARTLDEIAKDMQNMATASANGDFKKRLDAEKYSGDWQKLAHSINGMMEALEAPIGQAKDVMDALAAGKLDAKVTADAKGELHKLKVSSNNAAAALAKYTKIITHALENMNGRSKFLTDLPNDLAPIKVAINKLGDSHPKSNNIASLAGAAGAAPARLNLKSGDTAKKVSGALRVDGLEADTMGTPSYTQSDFGKY